MSHYLSVTLDCGVVADVLGWQMRSAYELVGGGFTTQEELDRSNEELLELAGNVKFDSMSNPHHYYMRKEKAHVITPAFLELIDPSQHPELKYRWHEPTPEKIEIWRQRLSECEEGSREYCESQVQSLEAQLERNAYSELPPELWSVELDSQSLVEPGWDGSSLIASWFQEPRPDESIRTIITSAIHAIPWNEVASNYEALP